MPVNSGRRAHSRTIAQVARDNCLATLKELNDTASVSVSVPYLKEALHDIKQNETSPASAAHTASARALSRLPAGQPRAGGSDQLRRQLEAAEAHAASLRVQLESKQRENDAQSRRSSAELRRDAAACNVVLSLGQACAPPKAQWAATASSLLRHYATMALTHTLVLLWEQDEGGALAADLDVGRLTVLKAASRSSRYMLPKVALGPRACVLHVEGWQPETPATLERLHQVRWAVPTLRVQ